jgi:protein arginine kinase
MSSEEVMNLLSAIRLGLAMGIIDTLTIKQINEILLLSQPAHLVKIAGKEMDSERRDTIRAQMVREKLA